MYEISHIGDIRSQMQSLQSWNRPDKANKTDGLSYPQVRWTTSTNCRSFQASEWTVIAYCPDARCCGRPQGNSFLCAFFAVWLTSMQVTDQHKRLLHYEPVYINATKRLPNEFLHGIIAVEWRHTWKTRARYICTQGNMAKSGVHSFILTAICQFAIHNRLFTTDELALRWHSLQGTILCRMT